MSVKIEKIITPTNYDPITKIIIIIRIVPR